MTAAQRLLHVSLAALVGCGGDLALPAPSGEGVTLLAVDGEDQTGRVGEELPEQLVVSVAEDGAALGDQAVAFSIVSAPAGVTLEPDTAFTSEDGLAATQVILGPEMGPYEIVATLVVADPPPAAVFEGAAVAGAPDTLRALSPVNQPGRREEVVEDAPTVVVLDRFGNPVAGAEVEWEVTAGGGDVSGATTADANGRATATWTLGDARGAQKLVARVEGAHGSPLTFLALVLF
jgi:Bacterial Ig-like domain (group 1)